MRNHFEFQWMSGSLVLSSSNSPINQMFCVWGGGHSMAAAELAMERGKLIEFQLSEGPFHSEHVGKSLLLSNSLRFLALEQTVLLLDPSLVVKYQLFELICNRRKILHTSKYIHLR